MDGFDELGEWHGSMDELGEWLEENTEEVGCAKRCGKVWKGVERCGKVWKGVGFGVHGSRV